MDGLFDLIILPGVGRRLKFSKISRRLRARFWNAGILLWWYRLWIRTDESDISLVRDNLALRVMSGERKLWYLQDLFTRRKIAHERFFRGGKKDYWRLFFRDIIGHVMPSVEYKAERDRVSIANAAESLEKFDNLIGLREGDTDGKRE